MIEYRLIPEASQDYQEAMEWYQNRSERAANGFARAVEIARIDICRTPNLWPYYDDRNRVYVLRRYPFNVIYRVEPDAVVVLAIAHNRRARDYWKDRG